MPIAANLCSHCGFNFNAAAQHPSGANPNWAPPGYGGYYRPATGGGYGTGREGFAIASLVLGIIAVITFCSWCIALPCAGLAIIFGVMGKDSAQKGLATAGMVLGIIAASISVIFVLFFVISILGGA